MIKDYDFRDFAGAAASAFNSLRFEPDKGLNQALQTIQQQRTANRAKNKTVEYLKGLGTPMGDRLAGMVGTGQLKGSQAYGMMFDMEKEARAEERARNLATFQNQLAMDRDAAKPVKPTNTQVLHNMALAAGHPEGSDKYNQIVFKLPAEKQLSPDLQQRITLADTLGYPEGSPEYRNLVYDDKMPITMPNNMDAELFNTFPDQTKKAILATGAAGINYPVDGTKAEQQAYLGAVMKTSDELSKEGTILDPSDPLYKQYVTSAFGKDFDMNQGIGGLIIKKKDNTIDFVPFSGGGVDVDVTVGTGDGNQDVPPDEPELIKQMAKKEMVPEYADPSDPSKGLKRNPATNQIVFKPAEGSKLEFDRKKEELERIQRNFSSKMTDDMKVDNITFSANRILDVLVGEVDSKTGKRPSEKDAKYNKSGFARLFTLDPPEAGVRGKAFGELGIASSTESVSVANFLQNIVANIGFDRLSLMREQSASGAGLGQVSNLELGQLNNSMRALQQNLEPKDLAFNVEQVVKIYSKILNDPIARAVKEASSVEEAQRLIKLHQDVEAGFTKDNIIFNGGDGSYTIKVKE
jgi:hypothetical protein